MPDRVIRIGVGGHITIHMFQCQIDGCGVWRQDNDPVCPRCNGEPPKEESEDDESGKEE